MHKPVIRSPSLEVTKRDPDTGRHMMDDRQMRGRPMAKRMSTKIRSAVGKPRRMA